MIDKPQIDKSDIWRHLMQNKKPILLYGMGDGADKIIARCEKYGIKISGVFASDGFVRHQNFRGFTVTSFDEALEKFTDFTVLVSFGSALPEVIANIKRISEICETYAPDVPVYGDGTFNLDFYLENEKRFNAVYEKLADDTSKKVFENIINYKITGKLNYLFNCETPEDEMYNLLNLKSEIYLDLGAYNGDTVKKFIDFCEDYKFITAVEPDKKSFKKLLLNTENLRDFLPVNKCIHSFDGTVNFNMNASRNSSVGKSGVPTECVTVDGLCKNGVSYIKFDVEGNEINALNGGKKTLSFYKPKMQIACYHKNEDLFLIPEKVLSLNPDYKIYIRHNPYIPAWDTNYIFI